MKKVEFFFFVVVSVENTVFSQLYKSSQIWNFPGTGKENEKKIIIRLNFAFHNVSKHNKCSLYVKFAPMIDTMFLFTKIYLYIEEL